MQKTDNAKFSAWWRSGNPWIWLTAGAVAISLIMVIGLLALIGFRGLKHFWTPDVAVFRYEAAPGQVETVIGSIRESEEVTAARLAEAGISISGEATIVDRYLVKTGNRDAFGADFRHLVAPNIHEAAFPEDIAVIERMEWGDQVGVLLRVLEDGEVVAQGEAAWPEFQRRIKRVQALRERIRDIERGQIGDINYAMERLRLQERRLQLEGELDETARQEIAAERAQLDERYGELLGRLEALYQDINRDSYVVRIADGRERSAALSGVVRAHRPNAMGFFAKTGFYFEKLWEFISDDPREANTEGGIFPAIFGTVMMVILMSVIVTPFGVIAAVYLKEYAKQGPLTRVIRIAVNNLAGVPSIVYGVFGLGFFVYFLGGSMDELFYPEAAPSPVFGTPGLLWSSLTLALLTLPVVIVATEEGLSRIPRSVREGSYALGATRAETLWRIVLPMASPAMMTGLILAIARAAGEVAPLMLVGVVKLAPSLPLDGNAPFLHLERKFMHLGFHIYDVGFQSPNVEAARPLVYATAFLLVVVIVVLNLAAVRIRNHLREKYRALEQ